MKTKLLKNNLLAIALVVSAVSFAQIDLTFDTDDDFEGFETIIGAASGVAGGILTVTPDVGVTNVQLRRTGAGTDVGSPATLTTVLIDITNNSASDEILIFTGGTKVATSDPITTNDPVERQYRIDIPGTATSWVGSFQFRLRFNNPGDGSTILVNRIQIVDPATLSTEDNELQNIAVYPNPTSDILNVSSPAGTDLQVYNILGVKVRSEQGVQENHSMNVSNLSSGLYFLKMNSEGRTATKKFQVK